MKKIFLSILMITICFVTNAQTKKANPKKFSQISVRGGLDLATKKNFTNYVKMPLKGFDAGLSYDKYWSWYGLGVDVDYLQNQKPVYNDAGLFNHILVQSGGAWVNGVDYTTSTRGTKLTRGFIGVGPSLKYQSKNSKFVAELNLRGGVTLTNGSALEYSTFAVSSKPWLNTFLTRSGNATGGLQSWGTFYHDGYTNDVLATAKAQVRLNYYVKPKIGINLGAHYMHYWGSDAKYNNLDWAAFPTGGLFSYWNTNFTSIPLPAIPGPKNLGLSSLSSMGITAGVSYRIGSTSSNNSKAAKNNLTVNVKDELTGLPLSDAEITIVNGSGKTYTATTNATGLANFTKIEDGSYTVSGLLHDIATTQQNVTLNNTNKNATTTLLHNDPRFTVQGKAINLATNKPEGEVSVSLNNQSKGSVKMGTTQNGSGQFSFQIDANSDYQLVGKKASYISNIEKISTKGLTRSQTLYVELEIGVLAVEKGKALLLQKIYYDLDKANIREDASSDLEKLTTFLIDNPTFDIEIGSHTDSRGSEDYNLKLSQERAQAVVSYLSQKGIDKTRLVAKGYGETQLINNCSNGANCSEEQHQLNRRTEFKVINK